MKVEAYLKQNEEAIKQQCQTIASDGSTAIVTVKENEESYIHKVSTVEEFTKAIPDNKFFKKMRDGINNAVIHKLVPVIIFEGQKARITSLSDYFDKTE